MLINKDKLKLGIWVEDHDQNRIDYDETTVDFPREAETVHVQWPLEIREEIYRLKDHDGRWTYHGDDKMVTFTTHIGGGNEKAILAMANSGDFTLGEAIIVWATACERCANALAYKYTNGEDGYPEYGEEWKKCPTECEFCKSDNDDTVTPGLVYQKVEINCRGEIYEKRLHNR